MGSCLAFLRLPSRVATLESRVATLEARIQDLEERFVVAQDYVVERFGAAMGELMESHGAIVDLQADVRFLYQVQPPEQA